MRDMEKIASLVKETLAETFDSVTIIRVRASADPENEDVLNIEVVFEGRSKDLDSRKVAGAVRHVRPKLSEQLDEWAFPLLSFISKGDAGNFELA